MLVLLAALLTAFATAQDDHSDHDAPPMDSGRVTFDLGDTSFTLVPLITRTDAGYHGTLVLTATDAMAPSDGEMDHEEHTDGEMDHDEHADDEADHEEHADDDTNHEEHADDMGDHQHRPDLIVALLDPSGALAVTASLSASEAAPGAYALGWFSDAMLDEAAGVWRLTVTLGEHRADVPISVVTAQSEVTELLAVFAPTPSLSSAGLTETFVYAYRALEPVHAAISVQRAMAGMQHATDEDRVPLVHDHFPALTDLAPVGEAMANRTPLNFAMAGTWDLTVAIEGDGAETFVLAVDMLAE
jgi:hypothetical protein